MGSPVSDSFGTVQTTVTMRGNTITTVARSAPMDNPRSAGINVQAVLLLQQETLQAQGAKVNVISGATDTSQAYIQSLQSALVQAPDAPAGGTSAAPSQHLLLSPSLRHGDDGGESGA